MAIVLHSATRSMMQRPGKNTWQYIWGDDHIRTLLRCRYALTKQWRMTQDKKEGVGTMFHGNFWPNIEMNMKNGMLEEHESRIRTPGKLYQMTDSEWMWTNLKDDMALQMYLYKLGKISDIDIGEMNKLAGYLNAEFDPYGAMKQLLKGEPRTDQEIVDFLEKDDFNYFDMNLVHVDDYKNFNLSIEDYYKRYFIGHYNPHGNHFFAYSIKPRVVDWLDPKPFTYQLANSESIDFNGYLEGLDEIGQ